MNALDPEVTPETGQGTGNGKRGRDGQQHQPAVGIPRVRKQHLRERTLHHCRLAYRLIVIINTYEHHLLFIEVGHGVRVLIVGSETVGAVYVPGFQRLESRAQLSLNSY